MRAADISQNNVLLSLCFPLNEIEHANRVKTVVSDTFHGFTAEAWDDRYLADAGIALRPYISNMQATEPLTTASVPVVAKNVYSTFVPLASSVSYEPTVTTAEGSTMQLPVEIFDTRFPNNRAAYLSFLNSFAICTDGDYREKTFFGTPDGSRFPSYEKAWRVLVVSATNRIKYGGDLPSSNLSLRRGVAEKILTLCQFHYSMLRSLRLAQLRIDATSDDLFDDSPITEFFLHLENAYEQAELFLIFWLRLFDYQKKTPLRKVNLGSDLLVKRDARKDILFRYLGTPQLRNFYDHHKLTQHIRDALVHGPALMVISNATGDLMPEISQLAQRDSASSVQFWRNLREIKHESIKRAYTDQQALKRKHFEQALFKFEQLWSSLIPRFEEKFFTTQSASLYNLR